MFDLFGNINKLRNIHSDSEKKKIAKLLQTTPEALEEFEKAYHLGVLEEPVSDNLFEVNAKQAAGMNDHITVDDSEVECVKGGMWYWNQIRKYFPEVFQTMAELEREIGHSCINGVFLDELDPERGRKEDEISFDCGIFCHLFFLENQEGQKGEPTKEE